MPRGKLIVIAAPSGAGKTTIVKAIMKKYPGMLFSISATTRPKREGEVDGKDYFFLTKEEFERRINAGEFVEWEQYPSASYGNYYGTLKSEVERALQNGRTMLFDVDVKGALSVKKYFPADAVLIFIKPPSMEVLRARLLNRRTEDEATMIHRLNRVAMEMEKAGEFHYQVINDDLQTALNEVEHILKKHIELEPLYHS